MKSELSYVYCDIVYFGFKNIFSVVIDSWGAKWLVYFSPLVNL